MIPPVAPPPTDSSTNPGSSETVLVYRLGSIGDTVVALPALHLIRRRFPKARLILLTNKPVAQKAAAMEVVLGPGRIFDDVWDFPVGTRDLRLLGNLARRIRGQRIRTVVHLAAARGRFASARDWLFFRLAGATALVGVPFAPEDVHVAKSADPALYESEARRLTRRLRTLGSVDLDDDGSWDLEIAPEEREEAGRLFPATFDGIPYLAASVGTKMPAKDWEAANWERLVERLGARLPGWGLLMVGAPDESPRSDACLERWPGPRLNLCGRLTPRQSAAAMAGSAAFLGHDSGPMHLASAVGVPCVAVFAARNLPGHWYPRGSRNRILYHQTECFGCGLEVCTVEGKRCILSISVDEVEAAVLDVLTRAGHLPAEPPPPR